MTFRLMIRQPVVSARTRNRSAVCAISRPQSHRLQIDDTHVEFVPQDGGDIVEPDPLRRVGRIPLMAEGRRVDADANFFWPGRDGLPGRRDYATTPR